MNLIPQGDLWVFITNMFVSGATVAVDAAVLMVALMLLIDKSRRWSVVIMIVLAHAFYGFLGLGILSLETSLMQWSIWIVVGVTSILGIRFVIEGLDGDEDGNPANDANILNKSLFSLAALGLMSGVSIDELFMVLQRFQWMEAQGWNDAVKAANIGTSMIVLFVILGTVKVALEKAWPTSWIERYEDQMMFTVFAFIMYYIIRAVVQNVFGFVPEEIPGTGIAWELLIAGFVATGFLWLILKWQPMNILLNKALLLSDDDD